MVNLKETMKGTLLDGFYPAGWDFDKIEGCIGRPDTVLDRQKDWNKNFNPIMCDSISEFEVKMGHEIAKEIRQSADGGYSLAMILPAGPMGMYKWKRSCIVMTN